VLKLSLNKDEEFRNHAIIGCESKAPFLDTKQSSLRYRTVLMSYLHSVYMLCNIRFNIISIVHKIVHVCDWSLISRAPNTMFHNV
jgi:hypothetical protein